MDLDDSVAAVVTGGASGLGEATVRMLRGQGVKVALFDLDSVRGEAIANEIDAVFCAVDVRDDASVEGGFARARSANGPERILVNCAGIGVAMRTVSRSKTSDDLIAHDMAFYERVVDINLVGTFRTVAKSAVSMAGLEPLDADGGRGVIVNTASIAAVEGQIGQAAYASSKGGIIGMTLPLARDLARHGVRAMAVLPGSFHTPMFDTMPDDLRRALEAQVPFPSRLGRPDEFAKLVKAIIENDMLNGENIRLDGALRLSPI